MDLRLLPLLLLALMVVIMSEEVKGETTNPDIGDGGPPLSNTDKRVLLALEKQGPENKLTQDRNEMRRLIREDLQKSERAEIEADQKQYAREWLKKRQS